MKKSTDVKYPNSASLFQFCRQVLDHKFGGIRVIDQDVGQILGFDPADCSHWKKGKKNIRSIQAMKSIADHLGVDEKLVVDVASGDIAAGEAFFECSGYGAFQIDPKLFEAAKKDYYRRNAGSWSKDKENDFKNFFDIRSSQIDQIVSEIHERINFKEAPLYLPEVVGPYPQLTLTPTDRIENAKEPVQVDHSVVAGQKQTRIAYSSGTEMRPYMRFRIAKAIALHFLPEPKSIGEELTEYTRHLIDVQSNVFAAKLLAPTAMIRQEMAQVNVSKDVVTQLAETFWVSKSFMNRRVFSVLSLED